MISLHPYDPSALVPYGLQASKLGLSVQMLFMIRIQYHRGIVPDVIQPFLDAIIRIAVFVSISMF